MNEYMDTYVHVPLTIILSKRPNTQRRLLNIFFNVYFFMLDWIATQYAMLFDGLMSPPWHPVVTENVANAIQYRRINFLWNTQQNLINFVYRGEAIPFSADEIEEALSTSFFYVPRKQTYIPTARQIASQYELDYAHSLAHLHVTRWAGDNDTEVSQLVNELTFRCRHTENWDSDQ